jgi:hypothetical protein
LGAAATQIVCDISLTNVTRRREPLAAAAVAAAVAFGAGALGEAAFGEAAFGEAAFGEAAFGEAAICDAVAASACCARDAGPPVIRTTVGAAAVWMAVTGAVPLPGFCCAALAPPPAAAQPDATVTAASTAAVPTALAISALVNRPGRRLPFPLKITGILPALVRSRVGDGPRHRRITENAAEISVIWRLGSVTRPQTTCMVATNRDFTDIAGYLAA